MDHGGGKLLGMVRNSHIWTLGTVRRAASDRLERAPGQADADAVLAGHRCGRGGQLSVPVGRLPGLPDDAER